MCSGFEQSAYDVIRVFSTEKPLTLREVMLALGDERFFLSLGGGNTLDRFVQGLAFEGFLKEDEEAQSFTLTPKGIQKRDELKQVVAA